jgi:hypothetical protein
MVYFGTTVFGPTVLHLALGDFATASAASPRHATVGNRHGVLAQNIQQVLSALNVQSQVLRRYHELHLKGLFDENEGIVDRPALYVNTANNISYISFMNKATP